MNGPGQGIRASELIKVLQECIREHGDLPVFAGGGDYTEPVTEDSVHHRGKGKGDGYVHDHSFHIL